MIEFSEMRGPTKIFGLFCEINGQNILFGPLISENSIVKPTLETYLPILFQQTSPVSKSNYIHTVPR